MSEWWRTLCGDTSERWLSGSSSWQWARAAEPWTVPPEGCRTPAGADDGGALTLHEGQVLRGTDRGKLQHPVPKPFLDAGDVFLHDGMRLEVRPCYRDYSPPAFFDDATRRFRSRALLHEDGVLEGHVAGLPFSPKDIDPEDRTPGLRWAWNATGAAPRGAPSRSTGFSR